jgi:predicted lipoprotein with Yx(FWY)xxD motif
MAMSARRLGWRRVLAVVVIALVAAGAVWTYVSPKTGGPVGAKVKVLSTSNYGSVLVVGSGALAGFPLYEFSGDVNGTFGCGTTFEEGYDFDPDGVVKMSCTGPESDLNSGVTSDDWPAFTTNAKPIAGKGANQKLLGSVVRPGIGRQVTYGGHPLYLFDPLSTPFTPAGVNYGETVAPLGPWHGYWFLVASSNGRPVSDRATIELATLPNGQKVLAAEEDPNVNPVAVVVYADSADRDNVSTCTEACAATWVPVLTTGSPNVKDGVASSAIGTIRRANGTYQVTYKHQALYLYSRETFFRSRGAGLRSTGTAGNGNGLRAPNDGVFSVLRVG